MDKPFTHKQIQIQKALDRQDVQLLEKLMVNTWAHSPDLEMSAPDLKKIIILALKAKSDELVSKALYLFLAGARVEIPLKLKPIHAEEFLGFLLEEPDPLPLYQSARDLFITYADPALATIRVIEKSGSIARYQELFDLAAKDFELALGQIDLIKSNSSSNTEFDDFFRSFHRYLNDGSSSPHPILADRFLKNLSPALKLRLATKIFTTAFLQSSIVEGVSPDGVTPTFSLMVSKPNVFALQTMLASVDLALFWKDFSAVFGNKPKWQTAAPDALFAIADQALADEKLLLLHSLTTRDRLPANVCGPRLSALLSKQELLGEMGDSIKRAPESSKSKI